jgi:hypothetical protein
MFNGDHGPLPFEGWCHCYFLRSPHGYLNVGQGCSASRWRVCRESVRHPKGPIGRGRSRRRSYPSPPPERSR